MYSKSNNGFTLIELLVVISIISLLSSIVITTLNGAKAKARDSAIKQELNELAKLAQLNYLDYGNYANLQPGEWAYYNNATYPCNGIFLGSYANQAELICNKILSSVGNTGGLYSGNQFDNSKQFSFMAYLPGVSQYACVGSSGQSSAATTSIYDYWVGPGCYGNP